MRRFSMGLLTLGAILLFVTPVMAQTVQQNLIDTVANGCKEEIQKYCSTVTPGEGRVLACLYAYEDKLSGRCEYALWDAAAQLERAVAAITYAVNECSSDLKQFCANTPPGEGRLLQCIQKNDAKVSARCKQARKDVGMK